MLNLPYHTYIFTIDSDISFIYQPTENWVKALIQDLGNTSTYTTAFKYIISTSSTAVLLFMRPNFFPSLLFFFFFMFHFSFLSMTESCVLLRYSFCPCTPCRFWIYPCLGCLLSWGGPLLLFMVSSYFMEMKPKPCDFSWNSMSCLQSLIVPLQFKLSQMFLCAIPASL